MDLTFSILTPNLNGGRKIDNCIQSLLDQEVEFEQLIMDGGSLDESLSIAESYPFVRVVSRFDNGSHEALDKGLSCAKGDIVGFLNSDDIYLPHVLEKVKEVFENNPTIGAVCGNCYFVGNNEGSKYMYSHTDSENFFSELTVGTPCFNGWFVRRDVALRAGGFDESIDYSGDRDFLIRVFLESNISVLDIPVYVYSMHDESRTMSCDRSFLLSAMHEHLSMIESYFRNYRLDLKQRRVLKAWKAQAIIGSLYLLARKGRFSTAFTGLIYAFKKDFFWFSSCFELYKIKKKVRSLKS